MSATTAVLSAFLRKMLSARIADKTKASPPNQGEPLMPIRTNTKESIICPANSNHRTRKSSTAQRAHRLRGPAARKRMPVRGDKQEPGLPERAANGQAGAEPVSRRSPYCWYLRPWQAARPVCGQPDRPQ